VRNSPLVRGHLALAIVAATVVWPAVAIARPAADVVVVWAPGARLSTIQATARQAGAAVIDRSPAARAPLATTQKLQRAIAEFDALRIDEAERLFDEVKADADRTGGGELAQTALSDLFLYRARIAFDRGDATAAWEAWTTALVIAPTRVIDPARFAPNVIAEVERARAALADRARAKLAVTAPPGCTTTIDGAPASAAPYLVGQHWVAVSCADREPWGTRIEIVGDITIAAGNVALAPPSTDEMLIQARTAGAAAFVAVTVSGGVATLRVIGVDGREREHRTASADRELRETSLVLRALLAPPPPTETPWYKRPWAWAAFAAVVTAAIVIPITAAVANDDVPSSGTAKVGGAVWE
jgi:hypothetical protein